MTPRPPQMMSRRNFMSTAAAASAAGLSASAASADQVAASRRRVIVCDVNETLLDIEALAPHFVRAFGEVGALREWFSTMVLYSNVVSLAGPYSDFGALAGAALDMVAEARGRSLDPADRGRILAGTRELPAHPDVLPALEALRKAGFRLVTLTNSAPPAVEAQLKFAGLSEFFERSFSVDTVRRFKPAPEPYRMVAKAMAVDVAELRLVAAHAWDVVGALQAGCAAAFVARPGKVLFPLGPKPDIVASDLRGIAERLIAVEQR